MRPKENKRALTELAMYQWSNVITLVDGKRSQSDIAYDLRCQFSHVHNIICFLERKRLVKRISEQGKRRHTYDLTPKGKALSEAVAIVKRLIEDANKAERTASQPKSTAQAK